MASIKKVIHGFAGASLLTGIFLAGNSDNSMPPEIPARCDNSCVSDEDYLRITGQTRSKGPTSMGFAWYGVGAASIDNSREREDRLLARGLEEVCVDTAPRGGTVCYTQKLTNQ